MIRRLAFVFLLISISELYGNVVNLAPKQGGALSSVDWVDETGRARKLDEFSGYPLILLPIYTRCPGACVRNLDHLKNALANSEIDPRQFRVLLFSFDATDAPAALAKYRQRESIPLGWSSGSASQSNIDAVLDSVGVQVGQAGTEFTHPNIIIFLDSKLRIVKWIYGTDYSGRDVDLALKVAAGESDWFGRQATVIYSLLVFAASIFLIALIHLLLERKRINTSLVLNPTPTLQTYDF